VSLLRPLEGVTGKLVHGIATRALQQNGGVVESDRDDLIYRVVSEDAHSAGVAEGVLRLAPAMVGMLLMLILLSLPRFVPLPAMVELPIFLIVGLVTIVALGQGKQIDVKPATDDCE